MDSILFVVNRTLDESPFGTLEIHIVGEHCSPRRGNFQNGAPTPEGVNARSQRISGYQPLYELCEHFTVLDNMGKREFATLLFVLQANVDHTLTPLKNSTVEIQQSRYDLQKKVQGKATLAVPCTTQSLPQTL